MAVEEHDPHTGYSTTGHEWNGIKELNTPVPRAVYFFYCSRFCSQLSAGCCCRRGQRARPIAEGCLGSTNAMTWRYRFGKLRLNATVGRSRSSPKSFADIQADPHLMTTVRQVGRTMFGDNCAACHGADAKGSTGFPNLRRRHGCGAAPASNRRDDPSGHKLYSQGQSRFANAGVWTGSSHFARRDPRRHRICEDAVRSCGDDEYPP